VKTQHDIAFEPIEVMNRFSDGLLRDHVNYCYSHSPFYRGLFDTVRLKPEDIQGRDDLVKLPVTSKESLEQRIDDFLCVSPKRIVDVCQTSGTTGVPLNVMQTQDDLERVGYNEEISFRAAGMSADDRVMIACTLGRCFMAGLAYFEGVRRLGAMAIRAGSGNKAILAQSIALHQPTVIICVPSQALVMGQALMERGVDPADTNVRMIICIGEPIRREDLRYSHLGQRLQDMWRCTLIGTYASTEMATSFTDCTAGLGGHFHPELIVVEILDELGNPVEPGQPGEIIVTPLQVTGMPLIRYCTGDIAVCHIEPCLCGRNSFRLGPIIGRKQQKLKIRGTTVYPTAIYTVLQEYESIKNYYVEVFSDFELSESLRVTVGVTSPETFNGDILAEKIRGYIRIKPEVVVTSIAQVAARTTQEDKRKPVLFFDMRANACK